MLTRVIPAWGWLRRYRRADLGGDLTAGLTVAAMLVPQGMAYAMLSGLPPVIGLYAVTIPLIVYAFMGSSRHLAVGPVAIMSLLTLAGVSKLAEPMSDQFIGYVLLLTLMVGAIQFLLGLLRLGFVTNFLSHAVISGFTSAAAIVIGLSQLGHLLGVSLRGKTVIAIVEQAATQIGQTHLPTLGVGLLSIVVLVLFRKRWPRIPAPLVVVAVGTVLIALLGLDQTGVRIVGAVPQGLPQLSLPVIDLATLQALLPTALTAAFVGFMESIAVAKSIAAKEKYKVNADQELKALGMANLVGAFFSSSPVTGGFSRTAVNYQAGARTPLASLITATMMLLVLLFLTPLFYYLPNAVLAGIVMVAVYGLIDLKEPRKLWTIQRADALTLFITFAATLLVGIESGILTGVAFSLLVFLWRSAYPHMAEMGYWEAEGVFRNVRRYPLVQTYPEAFILRIDQSLYFANMSFVESRLRAALVDRPALKWIILDMAAVNDMDGLALEALEELMHEYQGQDVRFLFAGMKGPIRDMVQRAGWPERYGSAIEPLSVRHALRAAGLVEA